MIYIYWDTYITQCLRQFSTWRMLNKCLTLLWLCTDHYVLFYVSSFNTTIWGRFIITIFQSRHLNCSKSHRYHLPRLVDHKILWIYKHIFSWGSKQLKQLLERGNYDTKYLEWLCNHSWNSSPVTELELIHNI